VLATVIDAVGSGLWMPFALLFFVRAQGIPLVGAGAALTTGGLIGLAATPAAGTAADRFGLVPVMITCNVIRFAGFACYPFVTAAWQIVPVAAVIAAGDRLFWTVNTPMVKALTTGRRAEHLIGTQTIARFAGAGAGAGLAAVLPALTSQLAYHLLAYLNAASFVAAALLLAGLRRTAGLVQGHPAGPADRAGTWLSLLRHRRYAGFCATHTIFTLASVSKYAILPLVAVTLLRAPLWVPGSAITAGTIVILVGQRPVTSYFSRRSRVTALMLAAVIFAVCFAALAPLTAAPEAIAAATILVYGAAVSVAEAIFAPVAVVAAAAIAPGNLQGRASAMFQLSWGISQVLAPVLLTTLLHAGNAVVWLTLSGLCAIASFAVWTQRDLLNGNALAGAGD
jgi:MFS family permease